MAVDYLAITEKEFDMKHIATFTLTMVLASTAMAHSEDGADKTPKSGKADSAHCMNMPGMQGMMGTDKSGMDMKGMDSQHCQEMMQGSAHMNGQHKGAKMPVHQTRATVKSVDAKNGKVVLAHEPVKSLNWPAMTMAFAVRDKSLFDKLIVGQKVGIDFIQKDKEYVVTAVRQ